MTKKINKTIFYTTSTALFLIPLLFSYFDFVAVYEDPRQFILHLSAILIITLSMWKLYFVSLGNKSLVTRIKNWDLISWAKKDIHNLRTDLCFQLNEVRKYSCRIRYRQSLTNATFHMKENGLYVIFDELQRGITPGQFIAWYKNDELIGSGIIDN